MVHVPYKGGAQAMTDVIAGRVPVTVESQAGVLPLITGGQLRPIAVTSAKRSSKLPNVPTFAESGLAGFDVSAWIGVLGPVRMPPAIFKKIADDVASVINTKEMRDRVFELGLELEPMSADQFTLHIKLEIEKYTAIAKAANIQAE
jgi:tripartite-type tricarboxylate transporter receptor subunit TctC